MKLSTQFSLDLGEHTSLYEKLLKEEDFDFKTKEILVEVVKDNSVLKVIVTAHSLLDLKIGTSAVMKSLEIISKTLEIQL